MTETNPSPSWGDTAFALAGSIAAMAAYNRGDLTALRRLDTSRPDAPVFWQLAYRHNLTGHPDAECKWAVVMHGIALMTRHHEGDLVRRSAHNGQRPVGRVLYEGGNPNRSRPLFSPLRLTRLLSASTMPTRHRLLEHAFRMLAREAATCNWREMAVFILGADLDRTRARRATDRIARAYHSAQWRATQTESETDNPKEN